MRPLDPDRLIVQANDLACAAFQGDLMARRLTLAALSCYEVDGARLVARVPVADFLRVFGLTGKSNIYGALRKAVHKAGAGMSILYQKPRSKDWDMLNLIESARYRATVGGGRYVEIFFGDGIKPWVLGLSKDFNSFTLHDIARIPSIYSLRMYEFLLHKSHRGKRSVHVALDELKTVLHLLYEDPEGKTVEKYQSNSDFMRYVVNKAQKELAKTSNLTFHVEPILHGQAIGGLKFLVNIGGETARVGNEPSLSHEEAALVAELAELGYADDAAELIRREGLAFVRATLTLTKKVIRGAPSNDPIQNPGGFFKSLITKRTAEKMQLADEVSQKSKAESPDDVAKTLADAFEQARAKCAGDVWNDLGPDDRALVHFAMRESLHRFTLEKIEAEGWGGTGTLYLQNRKDVLLQHYGHSFPPHLHDIAAWAEETGKLGGYDPEFKERVLQAARSEVSGGASASDSDAA